MWRGRDQQFRDRREAGRELALQLEHLRGADMVVLALPRGGVPVGYEVASRLGAPLDVIVVRKLGVPGQPELAMGAIGENGVRVVDEELLTRARVRPDDLERIERAERTELERRVRRYRGDREPVSLDGKRAVIVDDGIATGSTARAAALVARAAGASSVVVAVPVGPADARERLGADVDEVVIARTPYPFYALGAFYADFSQTTDEEVRRLVGVDAS